MVSLLLSNYGIGQYGAPIAPPFLIGDIMATILYRNGEEIRVKPRQIQPHLDNGWSLEPQPYADPEPEYSPNTEDFFDEGMPEDPTANMGQALDVAKIRELAREKGITSWDKKRIKTLKSELGIE